MISSKKYVDETLKANNLVANKALGQNFLVEEGIAKEIVESANITNESCVIEIGPGLGALTEFIVNKAKLTILFEIDKNMVNILNETFKGQQSLKIINQDFVKVDIEKLIATLNENGYKDIIFLSNLPYYITSKLLNKILVNNYNIHTIVAMMQKEVGQKILKPQKKDINPLSIILNYQYDVSIVKYVGKNSYLPRPEIDSIVLKFEKVAPKYAVNFNNLLEVTNSLFSARRKTISNNLKNLFATQEEMIEKLKAINLDVSLHIEQLTLDNIIEISKLLDK